MQVLPPECYPLALSAAVTQGSLVVPLPADDANYYKVFEALQSLLHPLHTLTVDAHAMCMSSGTMMCGGDALASSLAPLSQLRSLKVVGVQRVVVPLSMTSLTGAPSPWSRPASSFQSIWNDRP